MFPEYGVQQKYTVRSLLAPRNRTLHFYLDSSVHLLPAFLRNWWQLRRLKKIVRHAHDEVLAYRELWQAHGKSPGRLRRLFDFGSFPTTNKDFFKRQPILATINSKFPEEVIVWKQTSGSTGMPFRFAAVNIELPEYLVFSWYRFLFWRGWSLSTLQNLRVAKMSDSDTKLSRHLGIPIKDARENESGVLSALHSFRPQVIEGWPNVLLHLANENVKKDVPVNVPYVICYGESLGKTTRTMIGRAFAAEVFDLYGLAELGNVGVECSAHHGFHIFEELYYVEIVGSDGKVLPTGKAGAVVVTTLQERITPMIRYDTGDRGRIVPGRCSCGVNARRLMIDGRVGALISVHGREVFTLEIESVFDQLSDSIAKYQFRRKNDGAFEILIVPCDTGKAFDCAGISQLLLERLGVSPAMRIVADVNRLPNGKEPIFIDEANA